MKIISMFQVTIEDMVLTVGEETAEQLKADPEYATKYAAAVKRELLNQDSKTTLHQPNKKCCLWKSPKCPTEEDHKSTLALLALRRSYDAEFNDKKTHKNEIWSKIATKMNETGFFVGEGVEARERVRQKFSNLQSTYIKYRDSQKRTGEGKLKVPKYFDELEEILGFKHKVNPILVIDSTLSSSNFHENRESIETLCEKSNTKSEIIPTNRFDAIKKTVRPKSDKQETLRELVSIQKQNQETRSKEFSSMMKMFQEQNKQRNNQILLLIEKMGEKKSKRKRRSSSSDE